MENEKHTVLPGVWQETLKTGQMRNAHFRTWNKVRKQKNVINETQTLFHLEYSKKHSKKRKIRNEHCRTWIMAKKLKSWKMRNTLYYLEYGKKHSKTWKMRNPHRRTWNMARKLKNVENETQTLFDLEYGDKI